MLDVFLSWSSSYFWRDVFSLGPGACWLASLDARISLSLLPQHQSCKCAPLCSAFSVGARDPNFSRYEQQAIYWLVLFIGDFRELMSWSSKTTSSGEGLSARPGQAWWEHTVRARAGMANDDSLQLEMRSSASCGRNTETRLSKTIKYQMQNKK